MAKKKEVKLKVSVPAPTAWPLVSALGMALAFAGFLTPQSGTVEVLNQRMNSSLRRHLGILFQESSLDPLMTINETLSLHGKLFGMTNKDIRERTEILLNLTGLKDRRREEIETLSGGLKRRLELARTVFHNPKLILLDEPTLGLDPEAKSAIWSTLTEINSTGSTLIVATNDVSEAERYGQTIVFLEKGRIVTQGTPYELKRNLKRNSVRIEWPSAPKEIVKEISEWNGVGHVTGQPSDLHITVDDASVFIPTLFQSGYGSGILSIHVHESTLEDAYFQCVGSPLLPSPEQISSGKS